MGFLDNLESSLKSLEARDEAEDQRSQQQRNNNRAKAVAIGPWVAKLKQSPFTEELLRQSTRAGFAVRIRPRITWVSDTLRLEAAGHRLEMRPTPEGIVAVTIDGAGKELAHLIDLDSANAAAIASEWIGIVAKARENERFEPLPEE